MRFGETLGTTVQRMLEATRPATGETAAAGARELRRDSEYADMGARVVDRWPVAQLRARSAARKALRRFRDWLRSRYGLREIILPEKYRVDAEHDVVVTYSSCLALVYFADDGAGSSSPTSSQSRHAATLYDAAARAPGHWAGGDAVGRGSDARRAGGARAILRRGSLEVTAGQNPLDIYGTEPYVRCARSSQLVRQPNAGDCVLFGAYDGYEIVSFDDQVGAHGSAGGDQV